MDRGKKKHLVITAGYKPLIPQEVIEKSKIINIHYSLLPKYRGLHSIIWALLNGEEYVGYSIHEIDQ